MVVPQHYIPHEERIKTLHRYLESCSYKSVLTSSLCYLVSIILKNNYYENGELKCHQEISTAVGTKFTPPYTTLFITRFQKRIFQNNEFKVFLWYRYLGDIFCIWTKGSQKLNKSFNWIKRPASGFQTYDGLFYNRN